MKKLYTLAKLSLLFSLFTACTFNSTEPGPIGPRGPQGPTGEPGPEAFVFEFDNVNFTPGNDYTQFLEYPTDFQPLETDHVLVYFLWDYFEDTDTDVWRLLPQTLFTIDGTLVYNYDHTLSDIKLFMEANFDMRVLGPDYTDGWIVRAVVVPGAYGRTDAPEVDFSDYHQVLDYYNLEDSAILSSQKRPKNQSTM